MDSTELAGLLTSAAGAALAMLADAVGAWIDGWRRRQAIEADNELWRRGEEIRRALEEGRR